MKAIDWYVVTHAAAQEAAARHVQNGGALAHIIVAALQEYERTRETAPPRKSRLGAAPVKVRLLDIENTGAVTECTFVPLDTPYDARVIVRFPPNLDVSPHGEPYGPIGSIYEMVMPS